MAGDDDLMVMVHRLSAMPAAERSFVLGSLDEPEARDVARLLKQVDSQAMSPMLQDLISDCADGTSPSGITTCAAQAIGKAAAMLLAEPSVHRAVTAPTSSWARFAARLLGR